MIYFMKKSDGEYNWGNRDKGPLKNRFCYPSKQEVAKAMGRNRGLSYRIDRFLQSGHIDLPRNATTMSMKTVGIHRTG